ncbi:MAG: hypothetical protein JSS62_05130 [Verrucomicrobia bacterium]|nr:hypothetical protein [Verrucomicrobiota bacterium]MBS0647469.1 hypothetical protein [Verrucomicrobiota bacterium]
MKKLAFVGLLCLPGMLAWALPISNPIDASLYTHSTWSRRTCRDICDPAFSWYDAMDVRIGFYGDYVFNRYLQVNNSTNQPGNCVDTTTIFTSAGTVTANIYNIIDVYGVFGATHLNINTNAKLFLNSAPIAGVSVVNLDFRPNFSWSAGGRWTVVNCSCFGLGMEGQYFRTNVRLNSSYDGVSITYFNNDNTAIYSEWQAGVGASCRFNNCYPGLSLVPYAGVKWAGANLSLPTITYADINSNTFTLRNLHSSKLWGYALGVTATLNSMFGVTVEGRWADESAVYAESQLRF